MPIPIDGSFYSEGRRILKAPKESKTGVSIGFPVATVEEYVNNGDEIAKAIADAMNAYEPLRS